MKIGKLLILILCIAIVAVSGTAATIAYFSAEDEDVNTFVLGNVKMTLDETKVTPDGLPVKNGETAERTTANEYHLVPGGEYTKDPTVTIKGGTSECYVRMLVTISDHSGLLEIFGNDFLPENFVEGWNREIWIPSGKTENPEEDTVTYEFRYYDIVPGTDEDLPLEPLFTKLKIPGESITLENISILSTAKISVIANGIQATGFENAEEAWESFDYQVKID